jgi:hypothetical protein
VPRICTPIVCGILFDMLSPCYTWIFSVYISCDVEFWRAGSCLLLTKSNFFDAAGIYLYEIWGSSFEGQVAVYDWRKAIFLLQQEFTCMKFGVLTVVNIRNMTWTVRLCSVVVGANSLEDNAAPVCRYRMEAALFFQMLVPFYSAVCQQSQKTTLLCVGTYHLSMT